MGCKLKIVLRTQATTWMPVEDPPGVILNPNSKHRPVGSASFRNKETQILLKNPSSEVTGAQIECRKHIHQSEKPQTAIFQFASPVQLIPHTASSDLNPMIQEQDNIQKTAAYSQTSSGADSLSIKPRRSRISAKPVPPGRVVVNPELLESLRGLPLPHAARSIGISVTAFKAACRKLGIRRWEHTRGRARDWNGGRAGPGQDKPGVSFPNISSSPPPASPPPASPLPAHESGRIAASWRESPLPSSDYDSDREVLDAAMLSLQRSPWSDSEAGPDLACDAEALERILQVMGAGHDDAAADSEEGLVEWPQEGVCA